MILPIATVLALFMGAAPAFSQDLPEQPRNVPSNESLEGTIEGLANDAKNRRSLAKEILKSMGTTGQPGLNPALLKRLEGQVGTSEGTESPDRPKAKDPVESGIEPMSLMDARMNYSTVVETHLAANSPQGHWPYRDAKTGAVWPLGLQKIDERSLRELGANRFAGCVLFTRKDTGALVDMDLTVDFSGDIWKISAVKLHKVIKVQPEPQPD